MNIVMLSDTHMPKKNRKLPSSLTEELKAADHIIHAGDWSVMSVYNELAAYAPVTGVHGNVDDDEICSFFPARQVMEYADGLRIGIVHGHGNGKTTEKRAIETFADDQKQSDVIVFGHSHIPILRYYKKQLLINPGSPTDKRTNPYYSFAVLNIGQSIEARHVFFE